MAQKIAICGTMALLLATVVIIFGAQNKTDLPPGVLAEMWIPISETAGIALNYEGSRTSPSVLTHGVLMIKFHGSWTKVYLDPAPENQGFMPVIK